MLLHIGNDSKKPLIIKQSIDDKFILDTITISYFLKSPLPDIKKELVKKTTTVSERSHPRDPKRCIRWDGFFETAATFEYPNVSKPEGLNLPNFLGHSIRNERPDVDIIMGTVTSIFNPIFSKISLAPKYSNFSNVSFGSKPSDCKFIGEADTYLLSGNEIIAFIENKYFITLPVNSALSHDGLTFIGDDYDLLEMYNQDKDGSVPLGRVRVVENIRQNYGYLAHNGISYGFNTCYDGGYFLRHKESGLLEISKVVRNGDTNPSLLQCMFYFAYLSVYERYPDLAVSPEELDLPMTIAEVDYFLGSDTAPTFVNSDSSYDAETESATDSNVGTTFDLHNLSMETIRNGTKIGSGATGDVFIPRGCNFAVKGCDSYANCKGYKMLLNEIKVYRTLAARNVRCVPKFYGELHYGGYKCIAMEHINGRHLTGVYSPEVKKNLNTALKELENAGIKHLDLKPENILVDSENTVKIIDFGMAECFE
jgi:predicted Ser/Thr protein kinase